jgi:hypothetical protein
MIRNDLHRLEGQSSVLCADKGSIPFEDPDGQDSFQSATVYGRLIWGPAQTLYWLT